MNLRQIIGNYADKVLKLGATVPRGHVQIVHVKHDPWCAYFAGRACNCAPDVSLGADLTRGDT